MGLLIRCLLWPFSIIYGLVVWFRNRLFDLQVLKSETFPAPVIAIGNITVGGTGKTPHTEYLIGLLKDRFKIAVLSRGYLRKTKDFQFVSDTSGYDEVGDEPLQMKLKFPEVLFAVDRNRVNGINQILEQEPSTNLVLLDDAYQHRYVKPYLNILLTDFSKPVFNDMVLPAGRLRESSCEKKRAHIILITKTPANVNQEEKEKFVSKLKPGLHQTIYFTSIKYGVPIPIFQNKAGFALNINSDTSVLIVSGIANPKPLQNYLNTKFKQVSISSYPDHYAFKNSDIEQIEKKLGAISAPSKIIITTEKDAIRITKFAETIKNPEYWFYIPIEIDFEEKEKFNSQILDYVKKYS